MGRIDGANTTMMFADPEYGGGFRRAQSVRPPREWRQHQSKQETRKQDQVKSEKGTTKRPFEGSEGEDHLLAERFGNALCLLECLDDFFTL